MTSDPWVSPKDGGVNVACGGGQDASPLTENQPVKGLTAFPKIFERKLLLGSLSGITGTWLFQGKVHVHGDERAPLPLPEKVLPQF